MFSRFVAIALLCLTSTSSGFAADTKPHRVAIQVNQNDPQVMNLALNNAKQGMEKTEGKAISVVSDATIVPSGVVRITELQEQGWSYVRP